jgi:hypothetical protein
MRPDLDTEPTPGIPAAADPERACLRRIRFGELEREGDRIVTRGEYRTRGELGAQRFKIVVSAYPRDERDVEHLVRNFRASFEAVPFDRAFLDATAEVESKSKNNPGQSAGDESPSEAAEDEPWDPGIDIDIELELEEPPPEGTEVLCGFIIDPPINNNTTPHRYKPSNAQTFRVKMHMDDGTARVRVYNGGNDTGRYRNKTAVGDTDWLNADVATPRAHVRGLGNSDYYWLRGGWTIIT